MKNIKTGRKAGLPLREVTEQEIHDIIYNDYTIAAKMLLLRDLISLNYMELMVILLINSYMNVLIKEPINMVVVLKIDVDLCWN